MAFETARQLERGNQLARGNAVTNWRDLATKLAGMAPALGVALGGPAGAVVGTLIADRLKVRPTPEAVDAALRADPDAIERMKEIDAELAQATLADTQHARESFKGHWMPPILTMVLAAMLGVAGYGLFGYEIPAANKDMANIAFGALLTAFSTAVSYWLGSSRGSVEKQDLLAQRE